jgi:DNA-binding PadR family transcriptional regulator
MYKAGMVEKELIAASTEPLILSLLSQGESYGYALIQKVRELSQDRICWTDGMLYPVLHRLEKQGRIKSRWKASETGRKRKYYSIQKEGRAALAATRQQWRVVHETLNLVWSAGHV